jgi:DNA polymerase IV
MASCSIEALELLERSPPERPLRLTGVSAQELHSEAPAQLGLFVPGPDRSQALNRALDAIAERFGQAAVAPADVLSLEAEAPSDEVRVSAGASRLDLAKDG